MAYRTRDYILKPIALGAMAGALALSQIAPATADPAAIKQLEGSWRGSGTVTPSRGGRERISCRVKYGVIGTNVKQNINCAGADYKINVNGTYKVTGNNISGSWTETKNNYNGGASGSVKGNSINMRISGVSFTGTMAIKMTGRNQNVRITRYDAKSKKYVNLANISLRK
jgi:hypothetical protein